MKEVLSIGGKNTISPVNDVNVWFAKGQFVRTQVVLTLMPERELLSE